MMLLPKRLLATRLAIAAALALTLRLTLLLALAVLLLLLLLLRTTTITTGCTDHGSGHLGGGVHLYSNARLLFWTRDSESV